MLNKQDTGALKGIAILCIAIHNFCHWLPMAVHENEYVFRLEDSLKLLHHVQMLHPQVLLNVFSHFGHYGVPVFLFLSGYGLVCKYERSHSNNLLSPPFFPLCRLIRARAARGSALCTHPHREVVATDAAGATALRDHAICLPREF